jgi:hypothetical protein
VQQRLRRAAMDAGVTLVAPETVHLAADTKLGRDVVIEPYVVFTLGDNAYPDGSDRDFALCFTPSWGDSTKRIMRNIRPSPGNHEHAIFGAAAYYEYFGKSAGSPRKVLAATRWASGM